MGAGQRGEGPPQAWETGGGLVSEPLGEQSQVSGRHVTAEGVNVLRGESMF